MPDYKTERTTLANDLVESTRQLSEQGDIDRSDLEQIRGQLLALAKRTELWSVDDFPPPADDELQNRYFIAGEPEGGITLYLNVVKSGKKVPPHDHTTWACIAAVEGVEHNLFFSRTDDGREPGKATLKQDKVIAVGPGKAIAMMPDDIHTFEVRGEQTIRHLHFYGRPLETLSERKAFDIENDTYKIMDVGVTTIAS